MSPEITSAIINASASILVAAVGKIGLATLTRTIAHPHITSCIRPWLHASTAFVAWFLVVGLIWPDLSKHNFVLISPVAVVLVLVHPIRPIAATAMTLGLFTSNLIAGSLRSWREHTFNAHQPAGISSLATFAAFAFGWIVLVYLLSVWRNKITIVERTEHPAEPEHVPERTVRAPRRGSPALEAKKGITTNLYRLTDLYHRGNLSKAEFLLAKEELLGRTRRDREAARKLA